MPLTPSQITALRTAINADPALSSQPNSPDGHLNVAAAFNTLASPNFTVWSTEVSTEVIKDSVNWTEYINRSVGERSAFELLISGNKLNMARANVRQGIADIFSGITGVNSRTAIGNAGKRLATRAEKLFATGTGTNLDPAVMTFEGAISDSDVQAARTN